MTHDHNGKVGIAVLNFNRVLGTVLLGILTWLALQMWDDVKGLRSQVADNASDYRTIAERLNNHAFRLDVLDKRVDRIEVNEVKNP